MTSVKKQIVVETSQQRAFRTFTDGIDRWWPREHHIGASPVDPTGGSAPAPPAEPSGSPPPVSLRSTA